MFHINTSYISKDRYDLAKFLPWETDNFDVLDSYFLEKLVDLPLAGVFKITVEEDRPDLISYRIYGTVAYTQLILMYNSILDISELRNGTNINYFNISDLESLYFSLRSLEQ